ncbi:MAG: hypothetical protein RLZZ324_1129 [Candidatus Parcubacteria bacterium]|jgi:hypothetical protein
MFFTLLRNRSNDTLAALRGAGWAQGAVIGAFGVIGIGTFCGAFVFFLNAFHRLLGLEFAGLVLTRYVLEASFAFVFFLGVASFLASSSYFFYRDEELTLLMALPIPPERIFGYRLFAAAAASSWPVALLAVPALGAYFAAQGAVTPEHFLFILVVVALFTLAIAFCGALLSFLFAPITRRLPAFLRWALETATFLGAMVLLARMVIPRTVFALFAVYGPAEAAAADARLTAMFRWFPSSPFVRVIMDAGAGSGPMAAWMIAATALALVMLAAVLALLARASYLRLWQSYGARAFIARAHDKEGFPVARPRSSFPRFFRLGHGFLLEKDLLMLVRDGGEMARAAFLGGLMALGVVGMRAIAGTEALSSPQLFVSAVTFAFSAVTYLALTFCMRFAYPAFSLEGRGAWAVLSSPVHQHEVYSWKFYFWALVMLVLTLPATLLVSMAFGLPYALASFLLFIMACVAVSIVAVTLGQGALFPHRRLSNPDLIATTPSGLAATGVSLAYLFIIARYVSSAVAGYLRDGGVPERDIFGALVVSVALTGGYYFFVSRRMDEGDLAA